MNGPLRLWKLRGGVLADGESTTERERTNGACIHGSSLFYFIFLSKTHKQSLEKRESTHTGLMDGVGAAGGFKRRPPAHAVQRARERTGMRRRPHLFGLVTTFCPESPFYLLLAAAKSVVKTPTAPSAARFIAFHHRQKSQFASEETLLSFWFDVLWGILFSMKRAVLRIALTRALIRRQQQASLEVATLLFSSVFYVFFCDKVFLWALKRDGRSSLWNYFEFKFDFLGSQIVWNDTN